MIGAITMDTTSGSQPRTANRATRGAVAAGRGVVLFGFAVASLILEAVLLTSVALIPVGVGLSLTAVALRAIRGLQASAWRNEDGWSGFGRTGTVPGWPAGTGAGLLGTVRFPDGRPGHLAERGVEHREHPGGRLAARARPGGPARVGPGTARR
jgi:hypothetical protein